MSEPGTDAARPWRRAIAPALALWLGCVAAATAPDARAAAPRPPDYTRPDAWAAYPGRPSHADDVPPGVAKGDDTGVAVFFIHPTTYLSPIIGNADYDARGRMGERVDQNVLRLEATVFNGCCRIYAPRYRQASLRAITSNTPAGYAADDLAYGDLSRAFDEFLAATAGHPFIIAGHSQGSIHAQRLLIERVAGTPLMRRLVAAYLIGASVPAQIAEAGVPLCADARATGCVIAWNSVRRGHDARQRREAGVLWWQGRYQPISGRPLACVNPLSWRIDDSADASANLGALARVEGDEPLPSPVPAVTGAWCDDGLLGVEIAPGERRRFSDVLTSIGVYHDFDYALFCMNIRANVLTRIQSMPPSERM